MAKRTKKQERDLTTPPKAVKETDTEMIRFKSRGEDRFIIQRTARKTAASAMKETLRKSDLKNKINRTRAARIMRKRKKK